MLRWVVAAGVMLALPAVASAQDAAAGKKIFDTKCKTCHAVGPGAKNGAGPQLNGIFGRKPGTAEAFPLYSKGMKAAPWIWDEAHFKEYMENPKKKVPGNFMGFAGLPDELERDDITAYLGSFNADGSSK